MKALRRKQKEFSTKKNAERQEDQQKEIEMDVENMSSDDEDSNAQTYQRRIYEELMGKIYPPKFEAILFEYCKASVGENEEL